MQETGVPLAVRADDAQRFGDPPREGFDLLQYGIGIVCAERNDQIRQLKFVLEFHCSVAESSRVAIGDGDEGSEAARRHPRAPGSRQERTIGVVPWRFQLLQLFGAIGQTV